MKPIVIRRMPLASSALVALALALHVFLCYPAATSRGYPPMHPFWETLAPLLSFATVALLPFFDDRREVRRRCLRGFVPLACLVLSIAAVNIMDARPHYGHLAGMLGVLLAQPVSIVLHAVIACAIAYPASCVFEGCAATQWSRYREFAEPGAQAPIVRFSTRSLLAGVTIVCGLLAFGVWARQTYITWPRAEFSHRCNVNLHRIGLAMQEYHAAYASFPPAYIADDAGTPIHSWRVLLLPFFGDDEKAIYQAYRFDEPWNGPHNQQLAGRIRDVYRCGWDLDRKSTETSYLAVVGPRTAFPGSQPRKTIPDGAWDTVLVIEFDHSGIHWMEPRDLSFDAIDFELKSPDPIYPRLEHYGERHYLLNAAFADGSHRSFDFLAPDDLRALLTADGGEPNPPR